MLGCVRAKLPLFAAMVVRPLQEYQVEPLCVSVPEATRLLGVGRTKLYELINSQRLRVVKIGRRTLISVASVRALISEAA
jgi:excisionase family DNA binding protein